jgi:hypothetical protein
LVGNGVHDRFSFTGLVRLTLYDTCRLEFIAET